MKKLLLLICTLVTLGGCATNKEALFDENAKSIGMFDAISMSCISEGHATDTYTNYRYSVSRLMLVADMNARIYTHEYDSTLKELWGLDPVKVHDVCYGQERNVVFLTNEARRYYVSALAKVETKKRARAEAWSNALQAIADAGNSLGNTAAQQPTFIPIPAGQVTFGEPGPFNNKKQEANNYNYYLINTPTGQKQCHVARSGYIFCS